MGWFREQVKTLLHRLLCRAGYVRANPGVPTSESVPAFLESLIAMGRKLEPVCCLDSDLKMQSDLLRLFPPENVSFSCEPARGRVRASNRATSGEHEPSDALLVTIDLHEFDLDELLDEEAPFEGAEVVLLRGSCGAFQSGAVSFSGTIERMASHQMILSDILDYGCGFPFDALGGRILLAFERIGVAVTAESPNGSPSQRRIEAAASVLDCPIVLASQMRRLAGRGSFGFPSGVFNPGALRSDHGTDLLCRGEMKPWAIHKRSRHAFMNSCHPVHLRLDDDLSVVEMRPMQVCGEHRPDAQRDEDFRLFEHAGRRYSNHTRTTFLSPAHERVDGPLELDQLVSRVQVCEVDFAAGLLVPLGPPKLDRDLRQIEKNWSMFSVNGHLHLLYSVDPYCLYRAKSWPELDFVRVDHPDTMSPSCAGAGPLRNSVNPIPYDSRHLLHVVHQVFEGKRYVFRAVLIDRDSLIPVSISARPLASGWNSAPADILYLCSVTATDDEVTFYGGLNDSTAASWLVSRKDLDAVWQPWAEDSTGMTPAA